MAVHHACGGKVGVLSVLTVKGKPDAAAHTVLAQAARILVALDFDCEGDAVKGDTTVTAWPWWKQTYPSAKLWPVPQGKDPGEAFALGVDLRHWIFAALPAQEITVAQKISPKHEQMPVSTEQPAPALPKPQKVQAYPSLRLPSYFPSEADLPPEVLAVARAWQGKPITFYWDTDFLRHRTGGWGWIWDKEWAKIQENWDFLGKFQQQAHRAIVFDWLLTHTKNTITAQNFLFLWD